MKRTFKSNAVRVFLTLCMVCAVTAVYAQKPVKIFILAGQSNMVGHGEVDMRKSMKGEKGNLRWFVEHTTAPQFKKLMDEDGNWNFRNDVFIGSTNYYKDFVNGPLGPGYGDTEKQIGPELMFGNVIGDYYDEDVLLIKTSWGGASLGLDFLSPSALGEDGYPRLPVKRRDAGYYYVQMLSIVYDVIDNIGKYVPGYEGQGCQIVGFGWHQGWNDRCNDQFVRDYTRNLKYFIRDLRRDLNEPELPFVMATTSMAPDDSWPAASALPRAQKAILAYPEFQGNVAVVDTRDFWREVKDSPTEQIYHWNRNAESYCLIGESMGKAMIDLIRTQNRPLKTRTVQKENRVDLPTPPMGWNSWNAFKKEINEEIIKKTADLMVSTGMREAGYKYLVLDDAWMAADRNEKGQLMADSTKFPGGMKAVGDYIHSKGLKFGIYECRGRMTCQQLPGSFKSEEIDMQTFADWGVDYIKMDACFAESNGRLSSEDFAVYHDAILKTGRPIVLSISDFGQGAWAWGGKKYAHLWRTSMDIRSHIQSVYSCAETSGGANSSHPGFNGLGEFAGYNHWNDPDMLQVGNLENDREDKIHFSLWCMLSAPLMVGTDLRILKNSVKDILLAPEILAVNQDPRGVQGYKIFDQDSVQIYNKPLADGTTAVLLLNKGKKLRDAEVKWEQVGLSGEQPVRDLWARKDLGTFKKSFKAKDLGQHGHLFIKVGSPRKALLPGPEPTPLEKYTLTHTGVTYLSDLYYIMKEYQHPVYDRTFMGKPIKIDGKRYKKGLGSKITSRVMYKLDSRADRFKAVISIDEASSDRSGQFRVLNEDRFSGEVLYDSGFMKKGESKTIDIDVRDIDFLYLEFQGNRKEKGEVYGNWGDARVIVNRPVSL